MSDALHCPNCDGIIGGGRCGSCGWRIGDTITRHLKVNPFRADRKYAHEGASVESPHVAARFANRAEVADTPIEEFQTAMKAVAAPATPEAPEAPVQINSGRRPRKSKSGEAAAPDTPTIQ